MLRIARWIPAAIIVGISCSLSAMPTIEQMPSFFNADKVVHIICFGGLAFWIAFGTNGAGCNKWMKWAIPVILTSAYGLFDEIHQSYTPGRTCSVYDWVADVIGACLGSIAYIGVVNLFSKLRKKA